MSVYVLFLKLFLPLVTLNFVFKFVGVFRISNFDTVKNVFSLYSLVVSSFGIKQRTPRLTVIVVYRVEPSVNAPQSQDIPRSGNWENNVIMPVKKWILATGKLTR